MTKKKKSTTGSLKTSAETAKKVDVAVPEKTIDEMEPLNLEGTEDKERPEGTAWFVIHSYSGYENKVQKNLFHRSV